MSTIFCASTFSWHSSTLSKCLLTKKCEFPEQNTFKWILLYHNFFFFFFWGDLLGGSEVSKSQAPWCEFCWLVAWFRSSSSARWSSVSLLLVSSEFSLKWMVSGLSSSLETNSFFLLNSVVPQYLTASHGANCSYVHSPVPPCAQARA